MSENPPYDFKKIIVSIGGNAIIRRTESGDIEEQFENVAVACSYIAELARRRGTGIIITHGNGPVVGNIAVRNEAAKEIVPPMPLFICDADSEGGIGFMIQQTLFNSLKRIGCKRDVVAVITQTVVDKGDPAFKDPTKFVGLFYGKDESEAVSKTRGWVMKEDSNRGFRRVVPSPRPKRIVEAGVINGLADSGVIVIAAGGGGVPVVESGDGTLKGVDAVVDKDFATTLLALQTGAEMIINLTQIDKVYKDFGKPSQEGLPLLTVGEARRYFKEGHFPAGSMGPKIEAAIEFVEKGGIAPFGGREVIITTPELIAEAIAGNAGTRVVSG